MSKINGIQHVALKASDFQKSRAFYEGLGLKPLVGWGEGKGEALMLDTGCGVIELFNADADYPAVGRFNHVAFNVGAPEDVAEMYELALSLGAKPQQEAKTIPIQNARPYGVVITCAFVYGPDGESVEFFNMKNI